MTHRKIRTRACRLPSGSPYSLSVNIFEVSQCGNSEKMLLVNETAAYPLKTLEEDRFYLYEQGTQSCNPRGIYLEDDIFIFIDDGRSSMAHYFCENWDLSLYISGRNPAKLFVVNDGSATSIDDSNWRIFTVEDSTCDFTLKSTTNSECTCTCSAPSNTATLSLNCKVPADSINQIEPCSCPSIVSSATTPTR